jgi:hypothetical protein
MIVAQQPEPLAALHRAHIASIDGYWKQQDVAFALVIALGMIVYQKFIQGPPQSGFAEQHLACPVHDSKDRNY